MLSEVFVLDTFLLISTNGVFLLLTIYKHSSLWLCVHNIKCRCLTTIKHKTKFNANNNKNIRCALYCIIVIHQQLYWDKHSTKRTNTGCQKIYSLLQLLHSRVIFHVKNIQVCHQYSKLIEYFCVCKITEFFIILNAYCGTESKSSEANYYLITLSYGILLNLCNRL